MMGDRLSPVSYTITANGHINGADVYVAFSIREFVRTRKLLLRLSSPVDQKWINNWYYFSPQKMFFINTNVINWWPLSTGINVSSFLESMAETKQPSPAREYSWPQVDLCVGVMYHVTMETADICSEHRPEEAVTPTRAGTRKCMHRHTRARIFTYTPRGQAGQETVRRNQSQHSPLSLGVFTPRPLSEGLSTYSPIHWRST